MINLLKNNRRARVCVMTSLIVIVFLVGASILFPNLLAGKQSLEEADKVPELEFIQSKYTTLQYPAELAEFILHEVVSFNGQYTDAFYMKHADRDIPLFRFDFGTAVAGDWVGLLKTEMEDIFVTSVIFTLDEQDEKNLSETEMETYTACMDAYAYVLKGIVEDPNFLLEKPVEIGENVEVRTVYWTLMLPSKMSVQETITEDSYMAVFYGDVTGEHTALYQVCIGGEAAETGLGYYEIHGELKPVSVGSFELFEKDGWTEDDYAAAYRMMDTINDVIKVIMQSKQFSVEAE